MKSITSHIIYATSLLFFSAAVLADGQVLYASGNVALYRGTQAMRVTTGTVVQSGDAFSTGANGIVRWKMSDGSYYALNNNTQMRVEKYKMPTATEPPSTGRVLLRLFKGAMRTATGFIGKRNPDGWKLNTPTATLGVRGSTLITVVDPETGDTSAKFTEGSGYMTTNAGGGSGSGGADGTEGQGGPEGTTVEMQTGETYGATQDGTVGQSETAQATITQTEQNSSEAFTEPLSTGDPDAPGSTTQSDANQGTTQDQSAPIIEGDSVQ